VSAETSPLETVVDALLRALWGLVGVYVWVVLLAKKDLPKKDLPSQEPSRAQRAKIARNPAEFSTG
jgi:hypothetical protein